MVLHAAHARRGVHGVCATKDPGTSVGGDGAAGPVLRPVRTVGAATAPHAELALRAGRGSRVAGGAEREAGDGPCVRVVSLRVESEARAATAAAVPELEGRPDGAAGFYGQWQAAQSTTVPNSCIDPHQRARHIADYARYMTVLPAEVSLNVRGTCFKAEEPLCCC